MPVPPEAFDQAFHDLLRPISALLDQETITEILVNSHDEVYAEENGRIVRAAVGFPSNDDVLALLRALSQFAGQEIGPESPFLEASLPDGLLVRGVVPPVSAGGPLLAIRRHAPAVRSGDWLVERASLPRHAVAVLRTLVEERRNLLVVGPPGAGKTMMLAALTRFISTDERIVLVEDPPELALPHPHLVRLEARSRSAQPGALDVGQLLRISRRLRPDRIILGELNDVGAFDLLKAIVAGHDGCLTTLNAVRPRDALDRLEGMVIAEAGHAASSNLRRQIARSVDAIVLLSRSSDGVRRVRSISRVAGLDARADYCIERLYVDPSEPTTGRAR